MLLTTTVENSSPAQPGKSPDAQRTAVTLTLPRGSLLRGRRTRQWTRTKH